jgi:hypothetical protein
MELRPRGVSDAAAAVTKRVILGTLPPQGWPAVLKEPRIIL